MAKSKRKRVPKTVLKLPDLEQSKSAVLNSKTGAGLHITSDNCPASGSCPGSCTESQQNFFGEDESNCCAEATARYLATAAASPHPVWLPPLSPSIERASSALAISILSWFAIFTTRIT